MAVKDHVVPFVAGAGLVGCIVAGGVVGTVSGAGAGGVAGGVAAGVAGAVAGDLAGLAGLAVVAAVAIGTDTNPFRPLPFNAGVLSAFAASAFAAVHFGAQVPEGPASSEAAAPATTLVAEGNCEGIKATLPGSTGGVVKLVPPPGCTLKFAP